jgi:small-conductance mechanosensitive channel
MNPYLLRWRPALIGVMLLLRALLIPAGAATATNQAGDPIQIEEQSTTLKLANRPVFVFRSTLDDFSAEERCAAAQVRLHRVLINAKTVLVSTQPIAEGIQICLDKKPIFVATPLDVPPLTGETLETTADKSVKALRQAIYESHTFTSLSQFAWAMGEALALTGVFVAIIWLTRLIRRWFQVRITKLAAAKTENVKSRELRRLGLKSFVAVLRTTLNLASWLFIAFVSYLWFIQILRCFPFSRPWGEYLHQDIAATLLTFGRSTLLALPGLLMVVLIILAARLVTQVVSNLFEAVEDGDVQARFFDRHTASTTRRIVVFLIWVAAVVVAYPYIPGSSSTAFKGVTVFAGLILSLGSSSLVSQIGSGLILTYSRALRPGDYVRIGDTEGTVLSVGICSTYIRTIKNEEVHIANNTVLGSVTKNYSQLADKDGLLLPTKVTISYRTPWRQVEAMLKDAARRTPGLMAEPEPFVLQTALADFYVEYELNARLAEPDQRVFVLGWLHANIQDTFNEHGVQIMSPHYLADPPDPQVVPKKDWHLPPAKGGKPPGGFSAPK